jgi:hypothetical protein
MINGHPMISGIWGLTSWFYLEKRGPLVVRVNASSLESTTLGLQEHDMVNPEFLNKG